MAAPKKERKFSFIADIAIFWQALRQNFIKAFIINYYGITILHFTVTITDIYDNSSRSKTTVMQHRFKMQLLNFVVSKIIYTLQTLISRSLFLYNTP